MRKDLPLAITLGFFGLLCIGFAMIHEPTARIVDGPKPEQLYYKDCVVEVMEISVQNWDSYSRAENEARLFDSIEQCEVP